MPDAETAPAETTAVSIGPRRGAAAPTGWDDLRRAPSSPCVVVTGESASDLLAQADILDGTGLTTVDIIDLGERMRAVTGSDEAAVTPEVVAAVLRGIRACDVATVVIDTATRASSSGADIGATVDAGAPDALNRLRDALASK